MTIKKIINIIKFVATRRKYVSNTFKKIQPTKQNMYNNC